MATDRMLLAAVSECSVQDLSLLDNIGEDVNLERIIKKLILQGINPTLCTILNEIVDYGKAVFDRYITTKIWENMPASVKDQILNLDPINDIYFNFNFLASDVCFLNNDDIYKTYCQDAIEDFEKITGFYIC